MSEGLLGGILGEEDEKREAEAPEALASATAFASAIAAIASRQDPQVSRDTSAFLRDQSELLKMQKRLLEDEHALRLANLRGARSEGGLRRIGIRFRLAFQLFFAVVAALIAVVLLVMVRDAFASRSVVIDTFEISPNLSLQVPNGKIVAAGLLDVLTRIQAATRSNAEHRNLSNAWTNDIAVEVPETGISIGELERVLKARFGHEQHIDGDLVQTEKGGIALTVRGNGILPMTFSDEGRHLETLLTQAGEYIYGQSQPGLWTAYLSNNNRNDEAIRFARMTYGSVDISEKPYVLNYWANALVGKGSEGAMAESLVLYREALRLKPDYWVGYSNVMFALAGLGREEELVREGERLQHVAGGRPGKAPEEDYQNYDAMVWDLMAGRNSTLADVEAHGGLGTTSTESGAEILAVARAEAQMHDVETASLRLKTTPVDEQNPPDVAAAMATQATLSEELGDFDRAAKEWDLFAVTFANPGVSTSNPQSMCFAAVTYEKTGQSKKATAALDSVGALNYVDCHRFRGDVMDLRGDWTAAQVWYAKAVELAPSLPAGYYSWGLALAKHGDLDGALAKLKDANRTGPHWADPLKAWGDVLMKQGHAKEALLKYTEAIKYAPNWTALKQARDLAAKQRSN
jgi:tetratricopeptide (TPR) repeat protein